MSIAEALLTAEEYAQLPARGRQTELIRGRIVRMNMPYPRHGQICTKVVLLLGSFVEERHLGHVIGNDSGVVTERNPDTVRGADVAYYSYARVPPGPFPQGYLAVVPELVFEVRSPTDRWRQVLAKVVEYLNAGVHVVCVLDEMSQTVRVYTADQPEQVLAASEELALPDVLGDFRVLVSRFFE